MALDAFDEAMGYVLAPLDVPPEPQPAPSTTAPEPQRGPKAKKSKDRK